MEAENKTESGRLQIAGGKSKASSCRERLVKTEKEERRSRRITGSGEKQSVRHATGSEEVSVSQKW